MSPLLIRMKILMTEIRCLKERFPLRVSFKWSSAPASILTLLPATNFITCLKQVPNSAPFHQPLLSSIPCDNADSSNCPVSPHGSYFRYRICLSRQPHVETKFSQSRHSEIMSRTWKSIKNYELCAATSSQLLTENEPYELLLSGWEYNRGSPAIKVWRRCSEEAEPHKFMVQPRRREICRMNNRSTRNEIVHRI